MLTDLELVALIDCAGRRLVELDQRDDPGELRYRRQLSRVLRELTVTFLQLDGATGVNN